jgi:hypothetical protein
VVSPSLAKLKAHYHQLPYGDLPVTDPGGAGQPASPLDGQDTKSDIVIVVVKSTQNQAAEPFAVALSRSAWRVISIQS